MSLQRRRGRYIIIHMWKIANGEAPNDINMMLKNNNRRCLKAITPSLYPKAQSSLSTHYHNSFGVKTACLWNLSPKRVKQNETLASLNQVSEIS